MNTITDLPLISKQGLFWKTQSSEITDLFYEIHRAWERILKRGSKRDCFEDMLDFHQAADKLSERFTILLHKILSKSQSTLSNTFVGLALGADLDPLQAVLDAICLWRRAILPQLSNHQENSATLDHIADVGQGAILFCSRGSVAIDNIDFGSSVETVGVMGAIITALAIFQHARECKCISFEELCGQKNENPNVNDRRHAIKLFYQRLCEVWKTGYNVRSLFPGNEYGLNAGSDIQFDDKMRMYWQNQDDTTAWESIPKFHPLFKYPGSPWHKYFTNQNAPVLGPIEDEDKKKPIEILIPQAADDIVNAWKNKYIEAREKWAVLEAVNKSVESKQDRSSQEIFIELANETGIPYRKEHLDPLRAKYNRIRLDLGQEAIPKYRATDAKGNLTFPFMNAMLRAMVGEEDEEFVSDTVTSIEVCRDFDTVTTQENQEKLSIPFVV